MVYILDINNKPLMPTERHGHVRKLLRDGKACVIRRTPFTIRLNHETTSYVQKVSLGIGYKKLVLLEKRKNFLITKEGTGAIPPMTEDVGILAQKS